MIPLCPLNPYPQCFLLLSTCCLSPLILVQDDCYSCPLRWWCFNPLFPPEPLFHLNERVPSYSGKSSSSPPSNPNLRAVVLLHQNPPLWSYPLPLDTSCPRRRTSHQLPGVILCDHWTTALIWWQKDWLLFSMDNVCSTLTTSSAWSQRKSALPCPFVIPPFPACTSHLQWGPPKSSKHCHHEGNFYGWLYFSHYKSAVVLLVELSILQLRVGIIVVIGWSYAVQKWCFLLAIIGRHGNT